MYLSKKKVYQHVKGNTCKTERQIPFPSLVSVPIFSFSENGTDIHNNTFDSSFTLLHFPSFPTFNSSSYPIGSTFRNVLHLFLFSIYIATICVQATIIFLLHYCSSLLTGLHSYLQSLLSHSQDDFFKSTNQKMSLSAQSSSTVVHYSSTTHVDGLFSP